MRSIKEDHAYCAFHHDSNSTLSDAARLSGVAIIRIVRAITRRSFDWILSASILIALATAQSIYVPLASFSGTLKTFSKKELTIEKEDSNMMTFAVTRKTHFEIAGKKADASSLKVGEQITVQSRQDPFLQPEAILVKIDQTKSR